MPQADRCSRSSGDVQYACSSVKKKTKCEKGKCSICGWMAPHRSRTQMKCNHIRTRPFGNKDDNALLQSPFCVEGLFIDPRSITGKVARRRHRAEKHPSAQIGRESGRIGQKAHSNKALMDFLQNEKGKVKDECKLVAFWTRNVREYGCVKCGRVSLKHEEGGLQHGREGTCGTRRNNENSEEKAMPSRKPECGEAPLHQV